MKKYIQLLIVCICPTITIGQTFKEVTFTNLPEIVRLPYNSMDTNIADVDADGDLDIVIAVEFYKNIILLNDGKGVFKDGTHLLPNKANKNVPKPYKYYPYHDSEDVQIVDVNNDGLLDILFVTEDDKTNELYIQKTRSVFVDASDKFPVSNISNALTKGDFDGDGWVDFIIGNNGQNDYLQNNYGILVDDTAKRLPAISDVTQDIEVGDYDNDGDLDILIGNEGDNKLLQNNGKGTFTDVSQKVFTSGISEETREADFADVDNDGDLDIYFANVRMFTQKEPIQRLLINEGGKFIDKSNQKLKLKPTIGIVDADFYDLDNDGDLDLLLGKMDGFAIALNDGNGNYTENTSKFIKHPISGLIVDVEVADFNNDGIPDIYLSCFNSNDKLLMGEN